MRILGSRLTYANVMATLAVFIALGGAAYAADTVGSEDVIDESLASVDLKNNQVRSADVQNESLIGADVNDGSLDGGEIANESLTAADLGFGSVGAGELGGGAIPGQVFPPIVVSTAVNTTTVKELTVPCQFAQDRVTGGGFVIAGPGGSNVPNVAIQRSYAVNNHTWLVRAVATSGTPQWQLTGIATCVF